jgi:hypothetical protein
MSEFNVQTWLNHFATMFPNMDEGSLGIECFTNPLDVSPA